MTCAGSWKALVIACSAMATPALARDVHWTEEMATDAVLAGSALAISVTAPDDARYQGDEFPTQGFDDRAHREIHGAPTGSTPTPKERRYRMVSDGAVVTASALPAVMALAAADDATAGRVMTTGHTLLLSNLVVTAIKHGVRRPRPKARQDEEDTASGDNASSFPSGHSAAAFAGATLVSRFFPDSPWWARGGAWVLAGITALARVEGDKHFLTDVTVGAGIGVGAALAADCWYESATRSQSDSAWSMGVGIDSLSVRYRF